MEKKRIIWILSAQVIMLMRGKVTHKNLIDNRPLFRYYSSIWIEKTSLIQYNKVSGRYLYEGKNTIIEDDFTIQTQLKTLFVWEWI